MKPARGEIWIISPDFVTANEQAQIRPALVVSDDRLNQSAVGLSLVVPVTSRLRRVVTHIQVAAPEGGLSVDSALMCEQLRSLAHSRFQRKLGVVTEATLARVASVLKRLLVL